MNVALGANASRRRDATLSGSINCLVRGIVVGRVDYTATVVIAKR